jgi:hypothetical protein
MRIREYNSADLDELRRMHAAQGFGYPLPDLNSPLFVTKLVLEDDADDDTPAELQSASSSAGFSLRGCAEGRELASGEASRGEAAHGDSLPQRSLRQANSRAGKSSRIAMAVMLRLTAEAYLLHDPAAGTPRLRWQRFLALHQAARETAAARGLDDVQAFLPPRVARAFGRRLSRLGWARDPWACFSQRV